MKQFVLIFIVFLFSGNAIYSNEIYPKSSVNTGLNKDKDNEIIREVMPNDTKDDIAREFGISVTELEMQNPGIINELPVGFKLKIHKPENTISAIEDKTVKINFDIKRSYEMFVNEIINTAEKKIGTRYRIGGTSNSGYDCSGLIYTVFENFDINLPRASIEQSEFGTKIKISEAQKGDLIFFETGKKNRISHVGMIVEVTADGEIKFIHSSVQNGVIISSTKESYYQNNLVQVNRIL